MPVNGFSIDAFKSNYQDLARQYLFMVMITFPGGVGGPGTDRTKYLCQSTAMPESTIDPIEVNWQGMVFPLGSTHTFSDWTVTFRLDAAGELRQTFQGWQRLIHNPETNVHGSPVNYMQDQEVWLLNANGDPTQKLKLVSGWPTVVGELSLDYGSKEIQTFDVTWRYLYHRPV